MKEFDADLHFHGLYSGGVSKNMLPSVIAEQAQLKGLDIVSTADILHEKWNLQCKKELLEESNGVFKHRKFETYFILGTEVETNDRVHHLIYFPDFGSAENLKKSLEGTGIFDSWGCGRPKIRINSEELANKVIDENAIIGPAHAFTPYFSVYAHHDSMSECYGSVKNKISFMELGLSADTFFADKISDNHNYVFLTNSDSHSPWPHRIGREFTRIKMSEPNFKELKNSFEKKKENFILNVGFDPREGKYHCTACISCFEKYSLKEAESLKWKCPKCKAVIKKGVRDRILELADLETGSHPKFRPSYLHSVPLAEIIQSAYDVKGVNTKKVQSTWRAFIDSFDSEINILVDEPIENLKRVDSLVAKKINSFRKGFVHYIPGGGGNYGIPIICDSEEDFENKKNELSEKLECASGNRKQKKLDEF